MPFINFHLFLPGYADLFGMLYIIGGNVYFLLSIVLNQQ
jgi:hypothetical protein